MTVYCTPIKRDPATGQQRTTAPSADSGFTSMAQVREAMGEPVAQGPNQGAGWLVYGDDTDRVIFSRLRWA